MPKADTTFRPVGESNAPMHGAAAVLLSGFEVEEQKAIRQLMDTSGLEKIPAIYIVEALLDNTLYELSRFPGEERAGETAKLPRAIVMSGLTEQQLHLLMDSYRKASFPRPLWATVTPTNEHWPVKRLLIELLKERESLRVASEAKSTSDD